MPFHDARHASRIEVIDESISSHALKATDSNMYENNALFDENMLLSK